MSVPRNEEKKKEKKNDSIENSSGRDTKLRIQTSIRNNGIAKSLVVETEVEERVKVEMEISN